MDGFDFGLVLGDVLAGLVVALLGWCAVLLRRLCKAIERVGEERSPAPEPGSPLDPAKPFEADPVNPDLMVQMREPVDGLRASPIPPSKATMLAGYLEQLRRNR